MRKRCGVATLRQFRRNSDSDKDAELQAVVGVKDVFL